MEYDEPEGYSAEQIDDYFVRRPGSDFMVDVIKTLDIDYITTNPGSSFLASLRKASPNCVDLCSPIP